MKRFLSAAVLSALCAASAGAAVPAHPHLNVAPPGQVVQQQVAYLTGEAMHSMWYVVVSRKLAGKNMGKTPVYQYYISFYAPDGNDGGKLVYQIPDKQGLLLSRVVKAHGAQMYFPQQQVKIVGAGEFEQAGVQEVVIWDHQSAADCGTADVTVFDVNKKWQVEPDIHVENPCDLSAAIVKHGALQALKLSGPYYGPKAAMCCPTKAKANALLYYANGDWKMTPKYYTISASLAVHR